MGVIFETSLSAVVRLPGWFLKLISFTSFIFGMSSFAEDIPDKVEIVFSMSTAQLMVYLIVHLFLPLLA